MKGLEQQLLQSSMGAVGEGSSMAEGRQWAAPCAAQLHAHSLSPHDATTACAEE